MPRDCPLCGLVSPDTAEECECGYSFAYPRSVGRVQLSAAARRNLLIGALVCLGGLSMLLLLIIAEVRGVGFVAVGAILAGGAQFVRGWAQSRRERQIARKDEGPDEAA